MDDNHQGRKETDDAKEHLRQGLGLLWRAAREAATGFKKELDRSGLTRSLDDAGREFARAATNVVGRIEKEIRKVQPGEPTYAKEPGPQDPQPWQEGEGDKQRREEPHHSPPKPRGPTADDPGFWVANPSEKEKPQ